jgi:hypothetical protein
VDRVEYSFEEKELNFPDELNLLKDSLDHKEFHEPHK